MENFKKVKFTNKTGPKEYLEEQSTKSLILEEQSTKSLINHGPSPHDK